MAESENETTLSPTDQSTAFSTTLDSSNSTKLDITREELEKRQLLHSQQLLKLELSQKSLVIDTLRNEQAAQLEEIREKLTDALHEKRLLQMRLKSTAQGYEHELRQAQRRRQEELASLHERQRQLEEANPLLSQGVDEIKQALHSPLLSEAEYTRLRTQDPEALPLRDYIMLRYYELLKPKEMEQREKEVIISDLTEELAAKEGELGDCHANLSDQSNKLRQSETQCSRTMQELTRIRTQIQEGNYKIDNFDAVKKERDSLESELTTLRQALAELEGASRSCREERERARAEASSLQQALALLRQDKDYLTRQVSELSRRANLSEERSEGLSQQLAEVKEAKQRLYEEFLKTRQDQKRDHEHQLQEELEALRARTALEMEQIKAQTREMYERENRSACEARENAFAERDRAATAEREVENKYSQLRTEFHQLQVSSDARLSKLQSELQVKQFESEKTHVLHEEASRGLRQCELEQEKLRKKVEVLTQELWSVQNEGAVRVRELEGRLQEAKERLEVYEKLEKEMDDVIMQAAQMENETDAERVLFSYGFGASVPSTSRRRMQQSVQLARRVLQLERISASLRRELEEERKQAGKVHEELASANALMEKSQQPYSYLIESIRVRDGQIKELRESLAAMERELVQLRGERARLIDSKNHMSADLERLLNHREELALMRKVLVGLQGGRSRGGANTETTPTSSHVHPVRDSHICTTGSGSRVQPVDTDTHLPHPPPTRFTKQEPPQWYKRLKQRSQAFSAAQTT